VSRAPEDPIDSVAKDLSGDLNRMERDWDTRARTAPEYYIASGRQDWNKEDFFRGGEINVENEVDSDLANICRRRPASRMRMLEIGCGAGRMTRALARRFGEVHGVDISSAMIELATANLSDLPNVRLHKNNGKDLSGLRSHAFDFAFSFIVFQHIPSLAVIASYVNDVYRCLRPGSLFKFQVQGGRESESPADTWVGVTLSSQEAHALANACGFEVIAESGEGTQYYWLWFWKPELAWMPRRLRSTARKVAESLKTARATSASLFGGAVDLEFSCRRIEPGGQYAVTLPELAGSAIDVAYEFTAPDAKPVAGVVSRWCRLDSRGHATVTVAADTPAGIVKVTKVRAAGGHWRRAHGWIEVAGA
jgi:ubiquinone/menaquinone biosynthesis C-methylase UbiE